MKKLLLILFLATNVSVAQKKVALVITGYDTKMDDWEKSNVTFVDTSYWVIPELALSTYKEDTSKYLQVSQIKPWDTKGYEICEFHYYLDRWGTDCWLNIYGVIFHIARQKLISLGKL